MVGLYKNNFFLTILLVFCVVHFKNVKADFRPDMMNIAHSVLWSMECCKCRYCFGKILLFPTYSFLQFDYTIVMNLQNSWKKFHLRMP